MFDIPFKFPACLVYVSFLRIYFIFYISNQHTLVLFNPQLAQMGRMLVHRPGQWKVLLIIAGLSILPLVSYTADKLAPLQEGGLEAVGNPEFREQMEHTLCQ